MAKKKFKIFCMEISSGYLCSPKKGSLVETKRSLSRCRPGAWDRLRHSEMIKKREFSSAGSEHLPYKQRVGGSNPSTPTKVLQSEDFFILCLYCTYVLNAGKDSVHKSYHDQ